MRRKTQTSAARAGLLAALPILTLSLAAGPLASQAMARASATQTSEAATVTPPENGASHAFDADVAPVRIAAAGTKATAGAGAVYHPSVEAVSFSDLSGWREDDPSAALSAFLKGCRAPHARAGALGISGGDLASLCVKAEAARGSRSVARAFFEREFVAVRIVEPGFVTGYFEPAIPGSRMRTSRFTVPLYRKPDDLVKITASQRRAARKVGLGEEYAFARRTGDGGLAEYPDRAAIAAGALAGRGLEIAWVADPLDAFFIHIQGSARLKLADGSLLRLAYAAKSGQPYTAIGRVLIERGEIAREDMTMATLRAWMEAHREEARALIEHNRSYIFFREVEAGEDEGPVGAAGVPLTAGRSLAVDRTLHAFGTPVFIEADLPKSAGGRFRRLMIAQDTGSAIVGPARGDIFVGTGEDAGHTAGEIKHSARFTLLAPRGSRLAEAARHGAKP
ncbi:murein transglycosylase A [Breoghania corrubedonensis]|nr:MltA domain-containing protein [Breoghania corrubedonensis]